MDAKVELNENEVKKRSPDRLAAYTQRARSLIEQVLKGELSIDQVSEKIGRKMARGEEQVRTDKLAGILNGQGIKKQLGREIAHAKITKTPLALLMLDLDGFGRINKEKGFDEGNRAIKEMVSFLKQRVFHRETDSIGRLGGDEFVVICPFTDQEGATMLAEEIRQFLPDYMKKARFDFTTSVGVSTMRDDNQNVETLLAEADKAQMSAKQNGKDRVEAFALSH